VTERSTTDTGSPARVAASVDSIEELDALIVGCRACPRLVDWREHVAAVKRLSYQDETYWGRPVPGFGPADARVLIVGLAPAAHGGNRTGRIFTGDQSGDFLFAALFRAGLANQPASIRPDDGLRLQDAYIGAVNRCAPPANKPTPSERDNCLPYLAAEIDALSRLKVIVALGAFAWDGVLRVLAAGGRTGHPRPAFAHAAEVEVGPFFLVGCFHPSQQNTFTGRLTPAMVDAVLERVRRLAGG